MFSYERRVSLADTDATGIVYFTNYLSFAIEAVETLLERGGVDLNEVFVEGNFSLVVVHAEVDYLASLKIGDLVNVSLENISIGNSSVSLKYLIKNGKGGAVSRVRMVHAWIDKTQNKSLPLPELYRKLFKEVGQDSI